jgi:restriction system protein
VASRDPRARRPHTSRFTPQAREAASGYKTHRIVLIDGAELARLMIEHEVGGRTVQTIRVQRLDLEAYEGSGAV